MTHWSTLSPTPTPNLPQEVPQAQPASLPRRSARLNRGLLNDIEPNEVAASFPDNDYLDFEGAASPDPYNPLKKWAVSIPPNYRRATQSPQWPQWEQAMRDKLQKLQENHTWELIPLTRQDEPYVLPGKWVYDLKAQSDGTVTEFHARWVACGNFQAKTHADTSAPVVTEVGNRLFLTFCLRHNWVFISS